jgi:hypothetical protein
MTQPNNGPVNAAGGNEQKKHGAVGNVPAVAGAPASPPVVQKKPVAAVEPIAGDASKTVSPGVVSDGDKRRADAWNESGSRSPGTLPVQMTETRDPKSKPTDSKVRPHADAPVPGQKSPVVGTPTMEQGIRQAKGDDNRSSQPGTPPAAASQSAVKEPAFTAGAKPSQPSVPPAVQSGGQNLTSPTDPKPSVTSDPVQPKRPATVEPVNAAKASSVVPPSAGGSAVI